MLERQKSQKKEPTQPLSPSPKNATKLSFGGSPIRLQQAEYLESPFSTKDGKGTPTGEAYANYLRTKVELDDVINDLDVKLNRVLAKQEYEYLKGYNVYVRQKEKELKTTIQQLSERFNNQGAKEKKIIALQQAIKAIREEQIVMDRENVQIREKMKTMKREVGEANQEREFFEKKTKDVKKKNQLLKVAILRLQNEVETLKSKLGETSEEPILKTDGEKSHNFFLTELSGLKKSPRLMTTLDTEISSSKPQETILSLDALNTSALNASTLSAKPKHNRVKSVIGGISSRYAHIPTENPKFREFLSVLFSSKLSDEDKKSEAISYLEALETNYTQTIRDLRGQVERLQRKLKLARSDKANGVVERGEIEGVFVESIEEVRKEIMKRRIKNEVNVRRGAKSTLNKSDSIGDGEDQASKEFEESLMKLASLAKNRIKFEDFTAKDKFNLLDLFVNNEKTLVKIYEALFPPRQKAATQQNSPSAQLTTGRYGYHSGISQDLKATHKSGLMSPLPNQPTAYLSLNAQLSSKPHQIIYGKSQGPTSALGGYSDLPTTNPSGSLHPSISIGAPLHTIANTSAADPNTSRYNQDSNFILPSIINNILGGGGASSQLR